MPEHGNLPHRLESGLLFGLGACDMKGGVAVALSLAATVAEPVRDVTYVFYECEEVDASLNGLQRLADHEPGLLAADLAILMEPSNGGIEAGCQGTLRADVVATGSRAHSARSWLGSNAIHAAGEVLDRLRAYEPRRPLVDGLEYHEGLNAVRIHGGVAGNVIPDECVVTVNYRFAPDRSLAEAEALVRDLFARVRGQHRRRGARRAAGPRPRRRCRLRPGGGGDAATEVRVDRRRALLGARGARPQLRPW